MVKFNFENSSIEEKVINTYCDKVATIHKELHEKANDEKEFLGWIELPTNYDKEEFARIKKAAKRIRKDSEVLIVIGIGGSYLGARAVIEALNSSFYNMLLGKQRTHPQILYVGNNLSPNYINDLIEVLGTKDIEYEEKSERICDSICGCRPIRSGTWWCIDACSEK